MPTPPFNGPEALESFLTYSGEENRGMRQDSNLRREEDEEGKRIMRILKKTLGCCRMAKDEEARAISTHASSGHSNGPLVSFGTTNCGDGNCCFRELALLFHSLELKRLPKTG